jgi:hypothetical protein
LASNPKTDAEARYARAQKRAQDATKAMSEAQVEARRVEANTVRLKALRMAKEAADLAAKPAEAPAKGKGKKKAKVAAKMDEGIAVENLTAENDE